MELYTEVFSRISACLRTYLFDKIYFCKILGIRWLRLIWIKLIESLMETHDIES